MSVQLQPFILVTVNQVLTRGPAIPDFPGFPGAPRNPYVLNINMLTHSLPLDEKKKNLEKAKRQKGNYIKKINE